MRSIKLAKHIGFCGGVRRAINITEEALAKSNSKVYSLGAIIHNPEVIIELQNKGLLIARSLDKIAPGSTVILPSHGTPHYIRQLARKKKLKLVDVTCPYVSSVHQICRDIYRQGFQVIIVGDKKHPEIRALMDFAPGAYVIDKIKNVPKDKFSFGKIGIISQTTQGRDTFFEIVSCILRKNPLVKEVRVFNTICRDTVYRQEEVKKLAKEVDWLLIIGSSTSANTKRLLSIGRKINKRTFLVETKDAAALKILKGARRIGLISGASAPAWLAKEIVKTIKNNNK